MSKPKLEIKVQPSQGDKAYYLPLAPKSAGAPERLKIALRLKITNKHRSRRTIKIIGINYSFPDTSLDGWPFERVPQYIDPVGGVLKLNETATWSNGRVKMEDGDDRRNDVYLDAPAPPRIKVSIDCEDFTEPYSDTMELIPWVDPTGDGPVIFPFSVNNLESDEFVTASAVHHFNGGAEGGQLFAHDFGVEALSSGSGAWSTLHPNTDGSENSHNRFFGIPVRAIADGTVFRVVDQWDDNPLGGELEGVPTAGNRVWITHGNMEVMYSHLQRGSIIVSDGQQVEAGQKIAQGGNSGNTGGAPHLHMEGRDTATNSLRGFVFKDAWMLEQTLVSRSWLGSRVRMREKGVCQERAAIRPLSQTRGPVGFVNTHEILETLVAEVFGGATKGGEGFIFVGGKFIRVPPRGPKWDLLQSLIALDAVEQIEHVASKRIIREISETIAELSKELLK